jgi:hypothetical protein
MNSDQSAETTPDTEPATALPSTHFQTLANLEDGTSVGVVVLQKQDGDIQFYLDRQLTANQFGPGQIVEVLMRLSSLTESLNKYVNDRIAEAKEAIEKETQPELPLDAQPDSVPAPAEACVSETCCGGCDAGEVAAHAGQPE